MMALEDVEDRLRETLELQKALDHTNSKNEFSTLHQQLEHEEALKKLVEVSLILVLLC
jgi:hypothetical protein